MKEASPAGRLRLVSWELLAALRAALDRCGGRRRDERDGQEDGDAPVHQVQAHHRAAQGASGDALTVLTGDRQLQSASAPMPAEAGGSRMGLVVESIPVQRLPQRQEPKTSAGGHVIELGGVSRVYGSGAGAVRALNSVDLKVSPGEFVVVLGPSGSGKTTLLNVIGALDVASEGRVAVGGVDITRATRKELARFRQHTVSFIFQTFNLFPGLTALENVQFGADVSGRHEAEPAEVLDSVGLRERLHNFPHQLSGGEQQRVAIARALATGNPILLADEPTGELDFRTGVQILELLHEQTHELGTAVLVVTHNREISRTADRVVELSSGRIVSDAPPAGGRAEISELHW
jgi:putative ABC transport system ATP-binding protein